MEHVRRCLKGPLRPVSLRRPRAQPKGAVWYPAEVSRDVSGRIHGFGTLISANFRGLVPGRQRNPRSRFGRFAFAGTKPPILVLAGYQTALLGTKRYRTPQFCHTPSSCGVPNPQVLTRPLSSASTLTSDALATLLTRNCPLTSYRSVDAGEGGSRSSQQSSHQKRGNIGAEQPIEPVHHERPHNACQSKPDEHDAVVHAVVARAELQRSEASLNAHELSKAEARDQKAAEEEGQRRSLGHAQGHHSCHEQQEYSSKRHGSAPAVRCEAGHNTPGSVRQRKQ